MKRYRGILFLCFFLIAGSSQSIASESDCPQDWKIPIPNLSIEWDPNDKSFVSNGGFIAGVDEPRPLNLTVGDIRYKNLVDRFDTEFVKKLLSEGGNIALREVLAIEPSFSNLSAINSYNQFTPFPIRANQSELLRLGLLLKNIEGKQVKYFLEITKRGCLNTRLVISNGVTIPKTGVNQTPIGIDSWARDAEIYLRNGLLNGKKINVNWFTFDSNIKKFKNLLAQLVSLPESSDLPLTIPIEMKAVAWSGEDDLQFVPNLMGLPAKTCFWDGDTSPYYYYLDYSVILRSTPCKIVAFAPDYQKLLLDPNNKDSLVIVEVIDTPERKKLTGPIAEAKAAAELKAKQEAEAKAAAELKAKQEAEAKAAAELKAKQEAAAKAAAAKKTTITCTKGKLTKKVTAVKPKCPAGYKKR